MLGLVVWLYWIGDCLAAGDPRAAEAAKEQMKTVRLTEMNILLDLLKQF
jgi:hypothetical protein